MELKVGTKRRRESVKAVVDARRSVSQAADRLGSSRWHNRLSGFQMTESPVSGSCMGKSGFLVPGVRGRQVQTDVARKQNGRGETVTPTFDWRDFML